MCTNVTFSEFYVCSKIIQTPLSNGEGKHEMKSLSKHGD